VYARRFSHFDLSSSLTTTTFPDRPTDDVSAHAHKATLSDRYPRHRTPLYRFLVRPLQRRYVANLDSPPNPHSFHREPTPTPTTNTPFFYSTLDTDVILWEGDPTDPTRKPPEMYTLIENFCLGLRRLELFARARSLRRGWVSALAEGEEAHVPAVQALCTSDAPQLSREQLDGGTNVLGQELSVDRAERWDQDKWESAMRAWFQNGRAVVPMTPGTSVSAFRLSPFSSFPG
jgi:hypothetical protein